MDTFPLMLALRLRLGSSNILPADRLTTWNPGLNSVGGIPARTTIFTTLTPSGGNDLTQIQTAINNCPVGQVVALSAGTFQISGGNPIILNKGITVRGSGLGVTIIEKTDGAVENTGQGANVSPAFIIGPARFSSGFAGSTNLTADAVKGATSITVTSATGLSVGQFVLLDEASGASYQTDPVRPPTGQVWASPDYRVVWRKHNPTLEFIDDFGPTDFPTDPGSLGDTFSRSDRPTCEMKEIATVAGTTITFTTPCHIDYRTSHTAQLSRFNDTFTVNAGIEELTLRRFDDSSITFHFAAYCWVKAVESTIWVGRGFQFVWAFRCELRQFYSHHAAVVSPGGGAYALSLTNASADCLIEDGISILTNKPMVATAGGAGSVIGYCYIDQSYIFYDNTWMEVGINASHFVGPHHVLLEGNYAHNADSDDTHGNSIYITYFRNHLRGIRTSFTNQAGGTINDAVQATGPRRCAGPMTTSYWHSFVGNVMGLAGQMSGFVYESTTWLSGTPAIWLLGWQPVSGDTSALQADPMVAATIIRDGNYDHLTSSQQWHNTPATFTIPNSLYLTSKPAFFGANAWPWVNPATGATAVLPAKARFDAGIP